MSVQMIRGMHTGIDAIDGNLNFGLLDSLLTVSLREAGLDWDEVTRQVSAEPTGTVMLGDPSALSPCGANKPGVDTTHHGLN